ARLEPVTGKDTQTNHRATVGRRGGAVLVQFPHLARLGHRGVDVVTGTPVTGSVGSEPGRSAASGSADSRARQGTQDPLPSAGSRSGSVAGSLSAARAAHLLDKTLCSSR